MKLDIASLRNEIIGHHFHFETPFGERLMTYADYTASGRSVRFIENYLLRIQESYANTHTEDDVTGRSTTVMLHEAENRIKKAVNAGPEVCLVAAGTGSTGAIHRFQQIIGAYIPPATRARIEQARQALPQAARDQLDLELNRRRPVVFIGPYEHHSNEISWRECFAELVPVGLGPDGNIDLADLERKAADPAFKDRFKVGSFSACSNVTGLNAPVYDIARILHRHDAIACFDFAASAPYVELDMNHDDESYFDAVFVSPHKFLGGPGSSGLLLFRRDIYPSHLAPTCGAGGTVDYVSAFDHDFIRDIEEREKPGTPGTLQIMKAALALDLKGMIGVHTIEEREKRFLSRAIARLSAIPGVSMLGRPDPDRQIGILSFTIRHGERYLHPKLATRLLNDLFGIQSRAGCSCAGPYGHALLNIGRDLSEKYRTGIRSGFTGIKPGWIRVGFHFSMDDADTDFICDAIEFLAEKGHLFIPQYRLNLRSGAWEHVTDAKRKEPRFGLESALEESVTALGPPEPVDRKAAYDRYLNDAGRLAAELESRGTPEFRPLPDDLEALAYFHVCEYVS